MRASFSSLAGAHAACPPPAATESPAKLKAASARAIAITAIPYSRAAPARASWGPTRHQRPAPKIATFVTSSNEQRLVTTKKPPSPPAPARRERPDRLVERIVASDVLADQKIRPSSPHQAAACTARVSALSGCRASSSASAAPIAAGSTGRAGCSPGRARGNRPRSSTPHRPQPVRPLIARLAPDAPSIVPRPE